MSRLAAEETCIATRRGLLVWALIASLPRAATPMLFAPEHYGLWDQAGLLSPGDEATPWRMWYDAEDCPKGPKGICGAGLAVSVDGVHWIDRGMAMVPFDEATMGSGSVWQSPTDPDEWIINYSGACDETATAAAKVDPAGAPAAGPNGAGRHSEVSDAAMTTGGSANCGQHIRFQTSRNSSLCGPWTPRPDVPAFVPDTAAGYDGGRWDTITAVPHAGGLLGWWTAGCQNTTGPASCFGHGRSDDGVHWEALAPAVTRHGTHTVTAAGWEIGGVAPLTGGTGNRTRWYALVCMSHQELPAAIDGRVGCFTFVADEPGGPYDIASTNWALMTSSQRAHDPEYTYYTRFYHAGGGEVLANYQVYDRAHWKHEPARVYLAPLKLLILDPVDGALRMMWWPANNGLKVPASLLQGSATDAGVLRFDDADRGAIVEGAVRWGKPGGFCLPYPGTVRPGTLFVAAFVAFNGSAVMTGEATQTDCSATVVNDTLGVTADAPDPSRGLRLVAGSPARFRVMFRRGMYDVYVEDALIVSLALAQAPESWSGVAQEFRLLDSWITAADVRVWRLNLPANSTTPVVQLTPL